MVMAVVDRRISFGRLMRNWGVVYVGNFVGSIGLLLLMWGTGLLDGVMGEVAVRISEGEVGLGPLEAFSRGILCNILVCLAVWLTLAARSVTDKVLAVLWPISAFVLLGFEHSMANFHLIPQGMLAGAEVSMLGAVQNIGFVTLGNIVGPLEGWLLPIAVLLVGQTAD